MLDLNRMQVKWDENTVDLTVTEFWLVHALAKRPGHVRSRQDLMQEAHVVLMTAPSLLTLSVFARNSSR
ncbi:hypothetical protein [Enterovibrio coralii]|uniref:hypothetical protein n=1 Tax=Enterovibrio coralii TaxID=294935 RepID=UPI000AD53BC0|nr:hypothetical protein [Enterovibrio coralii]